MSSVLAERLCSKDKVAVRTVLIKKHMEVTVVLSFCDIYSQLAVIFSATLEELQKLCLSSI